MRNLKGTAMTKRQLPKWKTVTLQIKLKGRFTDIDVKTLKLRYRKFTGPLRGMNGRITFVSVPSMANVEIGMRGWDTLLEEGDED